MLEVLGSGPFENRAANLFTFSKMLVGYTSLLGEPNVV